MEPRHPAPAQRMPSLRQDLSLFDLTMIAIGSTIGSGIFLTPALITRSLEYPGWILAVWVIGGVMALSGALSFSELGAMMPKAGGIYVFLSETYGGLVGFLFGWTEFLVTNTGSIAALAIAFATYLGYLLPLGPSGIVSSAVAGVVLLTVVNVLGVKVGGVFSDIFTGLKILGIIGLIIAGFTLGSTGHIDMSTPFHLPPGGLSSSIALALVGVLWSIGGWQHATFTGAEVKNPQRNLPRAMIIAAAVITFLYILTVIAYMLLLREPEIASSQRLAADAMERVLGTAGGAAIAITVFISTFGTAGIYTLTAPRIYYAMALDRVFFEPVARLHPRFGTPAVAIISQSIWAIFLIALWGTFENLISYVVFTDWIFFGLTGAAVVILRRKRPDLPRPYRTVLYPVTPVLFALGSAWFVINTFVNKPAEAGAGILFLLLGVPVYLLWKKRSTTHPHHSDETGIENTSR
jgi:APA family basic amino acid/polyamine antiporter